MNPLTELKKKFSPRSRWGAIGIAPPRESGRLSWLDAEDRRQPQDGALANCDWIADEPEIASIPQQKVTSLAKPLEPKSVPSIVARQIA